MSRAASGAEREPQRELGARVAAPRQHEVADVGARDEQDQPATPSRMNSG